MRGYFALALLVCWLGRAAGRAAGVAGARHNVVHIVVDDLRPELGAYGLPSRHTPTIDHLAANGTVFDRAYCQQAVCGPSRNSFLTGRRPDASRTWNFINSFRDAGSPSANWTTLPGLFLRAGALALGAGKLFHPKMPAAYDGNRSWSAFGKNLPFQNPCWNTADSTSSKGCNKTGPASADCDGGLPCFFCPVDIAAKLDKKIKVSVENEWCTVDAVEDTESVNKAVKLLRAAAADGRQFYLAVGMHKPHMPWQFDASDLAKHPLDDAHTDVAAQRMPPAGMPDLAYHMSDDAADGGAHAAGPFLAPMTNKTAATARRAYRAAVTGMDRKLGVLLEALDELGLADSTAVVLHGDHGWHLGEQGAWRKFTNFEASARVPLIVRAPWLRANGSTPMGTAARSAAFVELVDVLPTIAELAGVPLPAGESFDGVSMVPLLSGGPPQPPPPPPPPSPPPSPPPLALPLVPPYHWAPKTAAFTQYPRKVKDPAHAWEDNGIIHTDRATFTHMGYSVRTAGWRYTEWAAWNGTQLLPIWGDVPYRELYDFRNASSYPTDFDAAERENVANRTQYADVVDQLAALIRTQFGPGATQ